MMTTLHLRLVHQSTCRASQCEAAQLIGRIAGPRQNIEEIGAPCARSTARTMSRLLQGLHPLSQPSRERGSLVLV
eukprot:6191091-Pleurochrysis_carterae.AAC.2